MSRESSVKPSDSLSVIFIYFFGFGGCRLKDARRDWASMNAVRVHRIPAVSSHFERSRFCKCKKSVKRCRRRLTRILQDPTSILSSPAKHAKIREKN